jgi:RHS repeat-associated protein
VKTVSQKANATAAEKVVARLEDPDANTKAYEAHGGEKYLRLGETGQVVEQTAYNLSLQPYRKNVGSLWSMDLHYCGGGASSVDCVSNNGNILKQVVLAPGNSGSYTMNYTYDSLNRIASAVEVKPDGQTENWHQMFVYDRFGNRALLNNAGTLFAKQAATPTVQSVNDPLPFDGKNRWLGAGYDTSGNQSTTWGAGVEAGSAQYAYDGENLLKQALVSNGVGTVSYGYDAEGRRVTAATGAGQTQFVYDAFGMLAMETGNVNTGGTGCTSCLVTADHLGSTRVVWDAGSGGAKLVYDYAPFGEEIDTAKRGGNPLYPATVYPSGTRNAVTQMFTGKERDAETGLDYFGARYFSGAQGRMTSPDEPFADQHPEDPQSWNLYAYTRNNPLLFVDPTGRTIDFANESSQKLFDEYEKRLNKDPKKYKNELATIAKLRKSDVSYRIDATPTNYSKEQTEGQTGPDDSGNIIIGVRNRGGASGEKLDIFGRLAHELEHGRQFDDGEIAFVRADKGWFAYGPTYDVMDEVNAFSAQLNVAWPAKDDAFMKSLRGLDATGMGQRLLNGPYSHLKNRQPGSNWVPAPSLNLGSGRQVHRTPTFYGVKPR